MAAHRLLARGWLRSQRGWWWATAALLGVVLGGSLAASGVVAGMEAGTEARVADFFTSDVRVTLRDGRTGISDALDANASAAFTTRLEAAGGPGTSALERLETQIILSRRSLLEAYFEEEEQYEVVVPGAEAGPDAFGAGLLLGLPGEAMVPVAPHLVAGRLPQERGRTVELALSLSAFASYLSPEERSSLSSWPPTEAEMEALGFEVTAGRVSGGGLFKDIVRLPARVVGLFTSGLDILDRFVSVGTLASARTLVGQDPIRGKANVFTVTTDRPDAVRDAAQSDGFQAEGADGFAARYVGQLLQVIEAVGVGVTTLLLAFPLFLVWHALQQLLDRQRRQIAVCRAIGVSTTDLHLSLARLALHLAGRSALVAVAVLAGAVAVLVALPPGTFPVPTQFALPWTTLATVVLVGLSGFALAVAAASRAVLRDPLGAALRA
ncbi:MAG: FtsX-like permease family protein [Candidatus Thermoplasmatota archaeon]